MGSLVRYLDLISFWIYINPIWTPAISDINREVIPIQSFVNTPCNTVVTGAL